MKPPQAVEKITQGYNTGDLDAVRYFAHRMKPSITNLGILGLKDDILKLEFIKEKNPENDRLVNKLGKTIDRVIAELKREYGV